MALVGRDAGAPEQAAQGAPRRRLRRARMTLELDALRHGRARARCSTRAFAELGGADIVILAVGVLGERGGMPSDIAAAVELMQVNFVRAPARC